MGGCSTYQIRKIYAIGQALGIVNRGGEDALHDLVYGVTGKSSVKELSYSEACKVIGELEARQGTAWPQSTKTNGAPSTRRWPKRPAPGTWTPSGCTAKPWRRRAAAMR